MKYLLLQFLSLHLPMRHIALLLVPVEYCSALSNLVARYIPSARTYLDADTCERSLRNANLSKSTRRQQWLLVQSRCDSGAACFKTEFPHLLESTNPFPTAVHMELFATSVWEKSQPLHQYTMPYPQIGGRVGGLGAQCPGNECA